MHVLILPSWYPTSYNRLSGIFFKEQAEALVKTGYKVGVIAIPSVGIRNIIQHKKIDIFFRSYVDNDVNTYCSQYFDLIKYNKIRKRIKFHLFLKALKKYTHDNGLPDIVHLHSYLAGDYAIYIKEKFNIPFVMTEHLSGFARNKFSLDKLKQAKMVFEKSDYNIAVSNEFKNLLINKFLIDFNYIPNVVDTDFFNLCVDKNINTFEFINVGFLDENKNQEMLIRAFSLVFKNAPHVKLTIVGEGVEYNNLKRLIKDTNMENQVSLFGRANREEVKKLLQNSDAFVLSSQYETFGVVLIEAMSCGLPVVSTKCGGPESIVNSNEIGLLCEIDELALSKCLVNMYKNKQKYNPTYIRQYVIDNFSEEAVCKKLTNVYEQVLK